ncbi:hypothetical protein [Streptomyces gobiensis]|uniref:hypothetical protein n=1 Tax=Streptomyces gobiensis TaxID=2875706 RepID=UPI001E3372FB|nr:hypothetical protein [Streptomyces gobiensis]UGY92966.1 hypothetical protein test1122_15445 [Streptomyces gobiensis]
MAPAVPPPPPPMAPPLPGYAPRTAPARPSAAALFLHRTVTGDWLAALKAALWPTGLLFMLALAVAIPATEEMEEIGLGFGARVRVALALLLQGLGGGFTLRGEPAAEGWLTPSASNELTLSVVPLTITVLWAGAVALGARMTHRQSTATAGPEGTVRIALLAALGVLLLGLFAQPSVSEVSVSIAPAPAALWALPLGALAAAMALCGPQAGAWLATRHGLRSTASALGSAAIAMAVVVAVCGLAGLIWLGAEQDQDTGWWLLGAFLLMPNMAVGVLGLSWGANVEAENGATGEGFEYDSLGLAQLGSELGGWAVVGALLLGVFCALTLGVVAARRSSLRAEQLLAAGFFMVLFLLLIAVGSVGVEGSADMGFGLSGEGSAKTGVNAAEALLFGLLWAFGGAFLGPYLLRLLRSRAT